MTITVAVADDQAIMRAGLVKLLESEPGLAVAGEAADGVEALRLVRETKPDVVLMDIRMPRLDGLEATRRIVQEVAGTRVIVLTTFGLDEYVFEALRNGASGFLLKDVEPEHLIAAIRLVATGDSLLAPALTRRLIAARVGRTATAGDATLDALTPPRARSVPAARTGTLERGNRGRTRRLRRDRQDARGERPLQALPARPCAGRDPRVRERCRPGRRDRV